MLIKKPYLLTPGPTPLPDRVLACALQPIMHHRTREFSEIYMETCEGIKYVFQTQQDVFVLTSSGSGAMEAAVVNTLSPGDEVISINGGKFGDRWGKICRAYGVESHEIMLEWGDALSPEALAEELQAHPASKAVLATLAETSTGTVFDIQGFGKVVSDTEAILVVDAISGIGATPCPMDDWKVDVLISASQKSFMAPPGLAYISFGGKAWNLAGKATLPKFYFDVMAAKKSLGKRTTPWSPAISLIIQQREALRFIRDIGLENLLGHHDILGRAVRSGVRAIGLELLSKRSGNILTAVKIPKGVDGNALLKKMQDKYKVHIAGAQEPHKGEFIRIAHLGYMGAFDIITALSALEMALSESGYGFQIGEAVKAAEEIIKENWQ
ncbi:MAG: alanine--glyoxylate aminotransferase family protein [Candidatus Aminicenantes bacterium]|nr:alanine--glyoxylate aminotransferase family protein [Candidatus Aminicenantes bacterium]